MLLKIVVFLIIISIPLAACNAVDQLKPMKNSPAPEQKRVFRDRSINKENAYNDIFLDSADVEQFISKERLNDTISMAIRDFYNARNYEYTWFFSAGLIEQSVSFRSLYSSENDTDLFDKSLENQLDRLRLEKQIIVEPKDPTTIKTELQVTKRFIQYAQRNYSGMGINLSALGTYIPAKRKRIIDLGDSVLVNNSVNNNYAALNESYRLLKTPLRKYLDIERRGGWPVITNEFKGYTTGDSNSVVAKIKKRLQITGELTGNDSSELFTVELENAVKTYQLSHGYKNSGIVTPELVRDMNIPALARIQQLIINMQRMRWMPVQPDGILIIVNIPEFEVYVDSGKSILFQMDVVVGADGHGAKDVYRRSVTLNSKGQGSAYGGGYHL